MSPIVLQIVTGARTLVASLMWALICLSFEASFALAQTPTAITPTAGIGDLGTTVTADGHTVQITGGTRPGNGANLFHSFDQFNVGRPDTAQFLNTTPSLPTSNILGRVTGGNPSSIFGTIDTMSYPGANLFLMNPTGIVFGPSATLHVGGSVAFTTADYLRLAEVNGSHAGIFHADATSTSLLTSASVAAFGFLETNHSAPVGHLNTRNTASCAFSRASRFPSWVATCQSGIWYQPQLSAPGGQIKILPAQLHPERCSQEHWTRLLISRSVIRNARYDSDLATIDIDTSGEGGGAILVRGGRLVVDDSTISANSTRPLSQARVAGLSHSGIGIDVQVTQDAIIENGAVVETNVESGAHHESGGVRITANDITVSGGPKILASLTANPESPPPFAGIRSNIELGTTAARSGGVSL